MNWDVGISQSDSKQETLIDWQVNKKQGMLNYIVFLTVRNNLYIFVLFTSIESMEVKYG